MNQIVVGMLTALVSAATASLLLVLFAKPKLQQERSFDRRLVWCESMMRAINAAGAAVTSASTGNDPGGREDCWSETIRLYENLIPLCGLKEIYAPESAVLKIRAFMSELESLIKAHLDGHRRGAPYIHCEPCLAQLREAAVALSKIARTHLGLEHLPDKLISPTGWFVGSFRGRDLGEHRCVFMEDRGGALTYARGGDVAGIGSSAALQ